MKYANAIRNKRILKIESACIDKVLYSEAGIAE